jgi:hypothetical protein
MLEQRTAHPVRSGDMIGRRSISEGTDGRVELSVGDVGGGVEPGNPGGGIQALLEELRERK